MVGDSYLGGGRSYCCGCRGIDVSIESEVGWWRSGDWRCGGGRSGSDSADA